MKKTKIISQPNQGGLSKSNSGKINRGSGKPGEGQGPAKQGRIK